MLVPQDIGIFEILRTSHQLIIPRFQRPYTWKAYYKNPPVKKLWNDMIESYESGINHFTGSIVLVDTGTGTGTLPCRYVVDGQQRLLTSSIFLCALWNFVPEDIQNVIEEQLNAKQESVYHERLRIIPSQDDIEPYKFLVSRHKPNDDADALVNKTFNFFYDELKKLYDDSEYGPNYIVNLYDKLISKIHVIQIVINDGEDPSSIFENLNGTGEQLKRIDLIRNYILMKLTTDPNNDYQKMFYESHWRPFENIFKEDNIENFLKYYYMMDGGRVSTSSLYDVARIDIDRMAESCKKNGIINQELLFERFKSYVEEMESSSRDYLIIIHRDPTNEKYRYKSQVSSNATEINQSLENLNSINASTFTPYLLSAFRNYRSGIIEERELVQIVKTIDSYFTRRSLYGGLKNNAVDKLFIDLCENKIFRHQDLYDRLSSETSRSKFWPTDDDLREVFMNNPYYDGAVGNNIIKFVLHRLDEKINKKPLQLTKEDTIEHVFPQDPDTSDWNGCKDYDFLKAHGNYLGNLTLSDHNQEHGRKVYEVKRQQYLQKENHPLTRALADEYPTWDRESFESRTQKLSKMILELWPRL